jgi:CheY-like chemotaxis protein
VSAGGQVLVVDDDQDIRETMLEVLDAYGYRAVGAADGREALGRLRERESPWCLVILDLAMPTMDGRAFRAEQRQDPRLSEIPVVLLSARHDVDDVALELEVAAHMTKPIQITDLLQLVRRFCGAGAGA